MASGGVRCARAIVARVDDQPPRAPARRTRGLPVQVGNAAPAEKRHFERAQQLCASEPGPRCVEMHDPASQRGRVELLEFGGERRAPRRVEHGFREERLCQRAQVEPGAAHDQHTVDTQALDDRRGVRRPGRGAESLRGLGEVHSLVRHPRALGRGRLGGADVEAAVHLPRVGGENREPVPFGEGQRDGRLARAGGTADDAQHGALVSAGRIVFRVHPTTRGRWWRARARRVRGAWSRRAPGTASASRPAPAHRPP